MKAILLLWRTQPWTPISLEIFLSIKLGKDPFAQSNVQCSIRMHCMVSWPWFCVFCYLWSRRSAQKHSHYIILQVEHSLAAAPGSLDCERFSTWRFFFIWMLSSIRVPGTLYSFAGTAKLILSHSDIEGFKTIYNWLVILKEIKLGNKCMTL